MHCDTRGAGQGPSTRALAAAFVILSTLIAFSLGSPCHVRAQAPTTEPAPPPAAAPQQVGPPGATVPAPPPNYYGQTPQYADPYRPAPGQPYVQSGAARPGDPLPGAPRPRRRISRGLMIGGIVTLGLSYLPGMLAGAILLDVRESKCDQCSTIGGYLFIPGIGPFLALPHAEHARGLLAFYGVVQLTGAIMTVVGIMKFRNSKRAYQEEAGLAVWDLGERRTLALDVAASPNKLGPQLALRF